MLKLNRKPKHYLSYSHKFINKHNTLSHARAHHLLCVICASLPGNFQLAGSIQLIKYLGTHGKADSLLKDAYSERSLQKLPWKFGEEIKPNLLEKNLEGDVI